MRVPRALLVLCIGLVACAPLHAWPKWERPLPWWASHAPVGHPKYPVVLVPGFFGFREMGVGPLSAGKYFRGVEERLRRRGVVVGTAYVGLINGVPDRARHLKAEIDRLFPAGKVNLIAHSTGGLDAREMICRLGMADRVASLTTVATPHQGTPVADWVQFAVGPGKPLDRVFRVLGIDDGAFHDLTTASCKAFNARTPDDPHVRYFSLGGQQRIWMVAPPLIPFAWLMKMRDRVASGRPVGATAEALLKHESWGRDVLAFLAAEKVRVAAQGVAQDDREREDQYAGKNDGMVPLWSTPHGESFEIIGMDHWDQIGWLTLSDTKGFYERLVTDLARKGL